VKLLIDVNLSPLWAAFLCGHGHEAQHWTAIGDARAPDREIMEWARESGSIVFTHDLDFGVLLALTRADGPSVIQVRAHDTLPTALGQTLLAVLDAQRDALESGALVTIDPRGARVRVLPIRR
jgi:predicted nuclease of predicted toxin-antitoxin system